MIRSHLALEALCPPGRSSCHQSCKCAAGRRQAILRGLPVKSEQAACGQISGPLHRAGNSARAMRTPTD